MKYIIGKPIYDSDWDLYFCHIALKITSNILFTAWGKDENQAEIAANYLLDLLPKLK